MAGQHVRVRVVHNELPRFAAKLKQGAVAIVGKTVADGEALTKLNIIDVKAVDTGNYLNSWQHESHETPEGAEGSWFSGVEYGPYLEYGTRYMAARPAVTPAAERVGADMAQAWRAFLGGFA